MQIRGMYREYAERLAENQKLYGSLTTLFLQCGSFYEFYDIVDPLTGEGKNNVKQVVETIGITLKTKKQLGPNGEDCYFAGFPEDSLQKFASMLTREGWTVVVCDQEKSADGKVAARPIRRIFSPGTHAEAAGTDAPFLAGVWMEEDLQFSAMIYDITTGKLLSFTEKADAKGGIEWSSDNLVHFFQVYQPRELLFWWHGAPFMAPTETLIRRRLGLQSKTRLLIDITRGSFEKEEQRKSFLERCFAGKRGLLGIRQQLYLNNQLTEMAMVHLLAFVESHMAAGILNLGEHQIWSPESSLYMGNNSLLQLNMIGAGAGGGGGGGTEQSIVSLFQKCITAGGKRALRRRLLTPSADISIIKARLAEVRFCVDFTVRIKEVEKLLRFIHDISRLHRKIMMYRVDAADILALDQSYKAAAKIAEVLEDTPLHFSEIEVFKSFNKCFLEVFDIEKAKVASEDASFLPNEKAPQTAAIERDIVKTKEEITKIQRQLCCFIGCSEESLRFEGNGGFLATKSILLLFKKKIDSGLAIPFPGMQVHLKKTSSGNLDFPEIENKMIHLNHLRYRLASAVKDEIIGLCRDLPIENAIPLEEWISLVDVSYCLAKVANERGYVEPCIEEASSSSLEVEGLRHPLLESIQTQTEYVKHNVVLGNDTNGWLLYGMNASGKSSLMKAVGTCVLLAQAGSFVPASRCRLAPFTSILTRILNQDNMWAGLSSFAVEVSELRDIFSRAGPRSLVLGDELCSGTESVSATSLVAAGIVHLHNKAARFVFATHLHGLSQIDDISNLQRLAIWHLRVNYDPIKDTLVYDRSLHKGPGGTLYGLEVAKAMHLPLDILKVAHKYRRSLLGLTAEETAPSSSWNSQITRYACGICGLASLKELEVHHIRPRADATMGIFADGSLMNDARNLVVVCQSCHDKHHAGVSLIGHLKQTSKGPVREVVESFGEPNSTISKSKWSDEQMHIIGEYLRKYKSLALKRIAFDLEQDHGMKISESMLRKIRLTLS